MDDDVTAALAPDAGQPCSASIVDITTTGRRSGESRRIETVFYRLPDAVYLSGMPAERPRAWLLNLAARPEFTFHLKAGVTADLAAHASVIDDPAERRRLLETIVACFNARRDPQGPYPEAVLDEWVANSPLARVDFPDAG